MSSDTIRKEFKKAEEKIVANYQEIIDEVDRSLTSLLQKAYKEFEKL